MSGFVTRPLRDAGNEGNPNKVGSFNQILRMGDIVAGGERYVRDATVATAPAHTIVLPDTAKAHRLLGGFIIAGGGGVGPVDVVAEDAVLASGQAKLTPEGNVIFFATDAVTEAEVYYLTTENELVTVDITVNPATGVGALTPRAGLRLVAAEALTGTVTGVATVIARAGTPATGEAALSANGENVQFLIADAVSSARVSFVPQPGFGPTPNTAAVRVDENGNL